MLALVALFALLLSPMVARADNVVNTVDLVVANNTILVGGSTTISYKINGTGGDGQGGCNASDGSPATVTLSVPAGVSASTTSLMFNACNSFKDVVFSSSTAGTYNINVSNISDSGVGSYSNQANFTLTVNPPPVVDGDGDGVADSADNCVDDANADQADDDSDGVGDACDDTPHGTDTDADGVPDVATLTLPADNCVSVANPNQEDQDVDGIGDACDSDNDNDGVDDDHDNCPAIANPDQADLDNDAIGSVCDNDESPPTIHYTLTPASPDGSNGWYVGVGGVSLTWVVTDAESDITVTGGCVDQNITADQAETTYSCSASSDGGSAGPVSVSIKRDATAPTFSCDPTPTGWSATDVEVRCDATDALSGIVGGGTNAIYESIRQTNVAAGTETNNASVDSDTISDLAGNTATIPAVSGLMVDKKAPTGVAFAGGIADGAHFAWNSVPAQPTCTAADGGSGLLSCVVTGYGTAVGSHTLTATATDNVGNFATKTLTYYVDAWSLSGFFQPVDMGTTVNVAKAGSTVPFKFRVSAGGVQLTNTSVVTSLTIAGANGTTTLPVDEIETYATGGTTLRYDATGQQFVYNFSTKGLAAGIYRVTITFADGSSLSALLKIK